jgi:hypothetical protein
MPFLIVNGFMSENAYSYSYPQHLHRYRWNDENAEALVKKMVKEFDQLIKKGSTSYYFIEIVRINFDAEQPFTSEIISKKVPLKEKVQLNKEAKGKHIPRVARFNIENTGAIQSLWAQLNDVNSTVVANQTTTTTGF